MEKNQQASDKAGIPENVAVGNQQAGQQLPVQDRHAEEKPESASGKERHSEGSRPQSENETLGTP